MKDIVNPLALLVVIALVACHMGAEGEESASAYLLWALVVCMTAFVADAALAVARAAVRRNALMSVVWSVAFLSIGCGLLATSAGGPSVLDEELKAFHALNKKRLAGGDAWARDEAGDCLLTLAASLGKEAVVRELLQRRKGPVPPGDMVEAARRAAENNRVTTLGLLLDAGVSANAVSHGIPLLCVAAQNGRYKTAELLLARGADVNKADDEGVTPLIHAVISESLPTVKLLRLNGADLSLKDAQGRDAASYSRSEAIGEILTHS